MLKWPRVLDVFVVLGGLEFRFRFLSGRTGRRRHDQQDLQDGFWQGSWADLSFAGSERVHDGEGERLSSCLILVGGRGFLFEPTNCGQLLYARPGMFSETVERA